MPADHRWIEIVPNVRVCRCFQCDAERHRIVARIAESKSPQHAARAARAFAQVVELAALAAGEIAELSGPAPVLAGK
jgi:hypothetical protein